MREGRDLVQAVVEALADAEGVEPVDLNYALQDHLDTEALRALAAMERTDWTLSVRVAEHDVTVHGGGRISVDGVERRAVDPTGTGGRPERTR